MTDIDIMRMEMLVQQREDEMHEYKMRTDFDFALDELNVSEDMTIRELKTAIKRLAKYDWDVTASEIIDMV